MNDNSSSFSCFPLFSFSEAMEKQMKYIFYLVAGNTYTTVFLALYLTLPGNKYITEGKNSDEERELDSYSEMLSLWKLEIVKKKIQQCHRSP